MKQITLSAYNKLHPDKAGIWTTERYDDPNWEQTRHLYIGKRTMLDYDEKHGTVLLIEGLSLEIIDDTPKRNYLIFCGKHAALINVPQNMSSDAYGNLQQWFAKLAKSKDQFAVMRHLWGHNNISGVWYHDELAGPDGASFEVFALPDTPEALIQHTVDRIRRDFDVVFLRVIRFETLHDIQADVNRIATES